MKYALKLLICTALLTGLLFSTAPTAFAIPRDGYEILNYDINADISADNVYTITETINFDVVEEGKHGIYRTIPLSTQMTRTSNGKTYTNTVDSWITDIRVTGCDYRVEYGYNTLTIWLGNPDKYMFGEQTVTIGYKLHFGDDRVRDFDEVYYNIIGDEWTSMTDKLTFSVTLPDDFDESKLGFSIGSSGSEGYNPEDLKYTIDGTTITGEVLRPLYAYEAVTMRLELPSGYFTVPDYRLPDWILIGVFGLFVLAGLVLFLLYGADRHPVITVEFYAPDYMTPAEAGYIIDGSVETRDIVSLLIYWAGQGCLRIEKEGSGYRLTRLKELGPNAKEYEQYMFSSLFKHGDVTTTSKMQNSFYRTLRKAISMVQDLFKKKSHQVFTAMSEKMKRWLTLLSVMPVSVTVVVLIGRSEMGWLFAVIMGLILSLFLVLPLFWLIGMLRRWRGKSRGSRIAGLTVALFLFTGLLLVFSVITDDFSLSPWLPWTADIATILLGILAILIVKRTPQGTAWLGKLLGLKRFIALAEKDRILKLVEENPSYFYHVLPYAYVLGVTDKWIKRFEDIAIAPPDWYDGYGTTFTPALFVSSIGTAMTSIGYSMSASPSSSSSGGGGGSSFSGGGSSGGGGGGGGGGSW